MARAVGGVLARACRRDAEASAPCRAGAHWRGRRGCSAATPRRERALVAKGRSRGRVRRRAGGTGAVAWTGEAASRAAGRENIDACGAELCGRAAASPYRANASMRRARCARSARRRAASRRCRRPPASRRPWRAIPRQGPQHLGDARLLRDVVGAIEGPPASASPRRL